MPNLTEHLDRLTSTFAQAHRLPNILAELAHIPAGSGDEAEAALLLSTLTVLQCDRDPGGSDRPRQAGSVLEEALRSGAPEAGAALRRDAHVIQSRLDQLARRGIRPPESVLPEKDFGGRDGLVFCYADDLPVAPIDAFGEYSKLDQDHPLRAKLKAEDCHVIEGRGYVALGRARVDDFGSHAPAYVPLSACLSLTLAKSGPRKAARAEYLDRERAEKEARRQAHEDNKTAATKGLEAKLAEQTRRIADLEARLAGHVETGRTA